MNQNTTNNNQPPVALQESEARAILEAAAKFSQPEMLGVPIPSGRSGEFATDKLILATVPHGRTLHSLKPFLEEFRAAPERKRGLATVTTLDSFVDHVNRHKDKDSVIFADVSNPRAPSLLAIFDYNRAGETGEARWGQHRVKYAFPVSTEWAAWTSAGQKGFIGQREFAEFLEDRIGDIAGDPGERGASYAQSLGLSMATPQQLLELSRGLTINVSAKVANHKNLSSGEGQVVFQETHQGEDGGPVKVPGAFVLFIPVFRGGGGYKLPVRLRYRVKDGSVVWAVSIDRADRAFDDAVGLDARRAADATELPLFFGTPES